MWFPMRSSILISGEHHSRNLIYELARRDQYDFVLFFDHDLREELQRSPIPYDRFEHYLDKDTSLHKAQPRIEALKAALARWAMDPKTAEHFSLGGQSFWPAIANEFANLSLNEMLQTLVMYDGFRRLLQSRPLAAVVVNHDALLSTKALVLAARHHGIPSLHVPHGVGNDCREAVRPKQETHQPFRTDWVAACGQHTKQLVSWYGYPEDRIVLTGRPAWDYAHKGWPDPQVSRQQLQLDPERPVILYCSTWMTNMRFESAFSVVELNYRAFLEAMRGTAQGRYQIVIKPHPGEFTPREVAQRGGDTAQWYARLASEYGVPVSVLPPIHPRVAIAAADLVLCLESNVGIEALMNEKPVISLDLAPLCPAYLYDGVAAVIQVDDPAKLLPTIEYALGPWRSSPEFLRACREAVAYFNGPSDGLATQRVVDLIDRIALDQPSLWEQSERFGSLRQPADATIEGRRAFNFLAFPDWRRSDWQDLIRDYVASFQNDDEVALVLWSIWGEELASRVVAFLEAGGFDLEQIPDIILMERALPRSLRRAALEQCQAFIPLGDGFLAVEARQAGLKVIAAPSREALKQARSGNA